MNDLRNIVVELESGTLSLETSLDRFEQGMALAKTCEQKLGEATGRVEKIMKDFSVEIVGPFTGE
ncbi:MAG: hypothetical protein ACD_62C00384G0001 [uncultured bacterium]|nr:MAG: hypothetical protein ACD_62C00384G0001 [uncultured bacterium]